MQTNENGSDQTSQSFSLERNSLESNLLTTESEKTVPLTPNKRIEITRGIVKFQANVRGEQLRGKLRRSFAGIVKFQKMYKRYLATLEQVATIFILGMTRLQALARGVAARKHLCQFLLRPEIQMDKIKKQLQDDVPTRQLLLGNRKALSTIYQGYMIYPEQSMTKSTFVKFSRQFHIMPKLLPQRDLEDLIDILCLQNHTSADDLLSFEEFMLMILFIAHSFVSVDEILLNANDRLCLMNQISAKLSILLQKMDDSGGKRAVSTATRNHNHIPAFIYMNSSNLPDPIIAKQGHIFRIASATPVRKKVLQSDNGLRSSSIGCESFSQPRPRQSSCGARRTGSIPTKSGSVSFSTDGTARSGFANYAFEDRRKSTGSLRASTSTRIGTIPESYSSLKRSSISEDKMRGTRSNSTLSSRNSLQSQQRSNTGKEKNLSKPSSGQPQSSFSPPNDRFEKIKDSFRWISPQKSRNVLSDQTKGHKFGFKPKPR